MYKVLINNPYMNTTDTSEYIEINEAIPKFKDIHVGCTSELYINNTLRATYINFGDPFSEMVFLDETIKDIILKNQH